MFNHASMSPKTPLALAKSVSVALVLFSALTAPALAAGLDLGAANGYAIVELGSGKTVKINSGPNVGNVLVGNSAITSSSGGGNGQITGTVFYDNTVTGDFFSGLQIPVTAAQKQLVSTTLTAQARADAGAVSTFASSLASTQSFSGLITGNGGINVINVASINNAAFTLSGTANDFFVFNVGSIQTNRAMTLTGGVTAAKILFNITGASGNVFQTSGGNLLYGTFLATKGGDFQFSNLALTGQLINTAGGMQIVSGSGVTGVTLVPEPTSSLLMMLGIAGLMGALKRRTLLDR